MTARDIPQEILANARRRAKEAEEHCRQIGRAWFEALAYLLIAACALYKLRHG